MPQIICSPQVVLPVKSRLTLTMNEMDLNCWYSWMKASLIMWIPDGLSRNSTQSLLEIRFITFMRLSPHVFLVGNMWPITPWQNRELAVSKNCLETVDSTIWCREIFLNWLCYKTVENYSDKTVMLNSRFPHLVHTVTYRTIKEKKKRKARPAD